MARRMGEKGNVTRLETVGRRKGAGRESTSKERDGEIEVEWRH